MSLPVHAYMHKAVCNSECCLQPWITYLSNRPKSIKEFQVHLSLYTVRGRIRWQRRGLDIHSEIPEVYKLKSLTLQPKAVSQDSKRNFLSSFSASFYSCSYQTYMDIPKQTPLFTQPLFTKDNIFKHEAIFITEHNYRHPMYLLLNVWQVTGLAH